MKKKEINEILENHERRLQILEEKFKIKLPQRRNYSFSNKKLSHSILLKELLGSDFCHSKNGLTLEEILGIFEYNHRPVSPKKIRDLLGKWKQRGNCDIKKKGSRLGYFIIGDDSK